MHRHPLLPQFTTPDLMSNFAVPVISMRFGLFTGSKRNSGLLKEFCSKIYSKSLVEINPNVVQFKVMWT